MTSRIVGISLGCLLSLIPVFGKNTATAEEEQERAQSEVKVHLVHADQLYFDEHTNREAQFLVGNVEFEHEGILMYCDSALYYDKSNSFDAYGNVRMNQGDTLTLVGDQLFYDGSNQLAHVRHNVILKHLETELYTDSLDYDRLYDLGYFFEGGRLLDQGNQLTSDWGQYSPTTRDAIFNYNVKLVNPAPPDTAQTTLLSDTLYYNTKTAIAHIVGPSNIDNGENHIYSEKGYYHTQTKFAYLLNRSLVSNTGKKMIGDSLVWDGTEKVGKAFGKVEYTDVLNKNMFKGDYCFYDDKTGYAEAADSALAIDYSQRDTMYIHADSFRIYTFNLETDSMYRMLHAYHHVRSYRQDVQAVCDSMVYSGIDSCLIMYKDPILWQMGQQLLGEEIRAYMNDSTMDSIQVLRQSLTVERIDSIHYNQVAGKELHSYFENGQICKTTVEGNVMVNYYPFDDDSLMVGMNHTETTEMILYMKDRQLKKIWTPAATGTLYPVILIPPDQLYLENFAWFDYIRPVDKDDLFEWRSKKSGSELKKSVQRVAPRQKLSEIPHK